MGAAALRNGHSGYKSCIYSHGGGCLRVSVPRVESTCWLCELTALWKVLPSFIIVMIS